MTESERRHKRRVDAAAAANIEEEAKVTHKDKLAKLNHLLGTMTEHNDIPRISAAGNG